METTAFNTYGRKIVIFFGHANSHVGAEWIDGQNVGGVQRTHLQFYQKESGYLWDSYENVGMVSYTKNSQADAAALPNGLDDVVIDFKRLLSGPVPVGYMHIDQMYIFGCLSAKEHDMAIAQGCGGGHDQSAHDMLYVGFSEKVFAAKGVGWTEGIGDKLVTGIALFFQQLGEGKTVSHAFQYLQSGYVDVGIQNNLNKAGLTAYGLGYGYVRLGNYGAQE